MSGIHNHPLEMLLKGQEHAHFLEDLNNQDFWRYAEILATTDELATTISPLVDQYLQCKCQSGSCIFPLATLQEIIPPPHHLSLFPSAPIWMEGITAWRSEILPVVDLSAYLTGQQAAVSSNAMLLIMQVGDNVLGLHVLLEQPLAELDPALFKAVEQWPDEWQMLQKQKKVVGNYQGAFLLDMEMIIPDIIHQISECAIDG